MLTRYLDQLQRAAKRKRVDLKKAVLAAGKRDSVYYRWINGTSEPTHDVAAEVMAAIDRLANSGRPDAA